MQAISFSTLKKLISESDESLLFDNMPSAGAYEEFKPTNVSFSEFAEKFQTVLVKSLLKKYGISCGIEKNYGITLVMAYDEGEYSKMKMQKFLNELDLATDVFIDASWAGNAGTFSDKVIYHAAQMHPRSMKSVQMDTEYDFQEFYSCRYFLSGFSKSDQKFLAVSFSDYQWKLKNTEKHLTVKYEDKKQEILDFANEVAQRCNCTVELRKGKTIRDGNRPNYEAFVIFRSKGDDLSQLGRFEISQDKFGDCSISVSAMGASYSDEFPLEEYKKPISDAIECISH